MLFEYAPIEPEAFPMLPTYIVLTAFVWFMTILAFRRWAQRKMKTPLLLFLTFLSYSICILVLTLGFAEAIITGEKREIYRFSLAFGYSGIMCANCILLLFSAELFTIPIKIVRKYIIISLCIAVFVALPINYYGYLDAEINKSIYIRPYSSAAMMFFSVFTYVKIYSQAKRIQMLVDEKIAKAGFQFIAISQICMMLLFIFLFADTVLFALTDLKGYTIFTYLGWLCAGAFMVFSYFGLIMPPFIRKRYE
jgi:hypothetical protein